MATIKLLNDSELTPEAQEIFDDIRITRQTDYINNFYACLQMILDVKTYLVQLKRNNGSLRRARPKIKEMIYIAVSSAHNCPYCIHSHTASARDKGMTEMEYHELIAIIGMAAETNRLATAFGVPIDERYKL